MNTFENGEIVRVVGTVYPGLRDAVGHVGTVKGPVIEDGAVIGYLVLFDDPNDQRWQNWMADAVFEPDELQSVTDYENNVENLDSTEGE